MLVIRKTFLILLLLGSVLGSGQTRYEMDSILSNLAQTNANNAVTGNFFKGFNLSLLE